jgi:hypothetical protein
MGKLGKAFKKLLGVFAFASVISGIGFLHLSWLKAAFLGAALIYRKKPKAPKVEDEEYTSPTYGFDGVATQANPDLVIPLIFGKHTVGGNVINTKIDTHINLSKGVREYDEQYITSTVTQFKTYKTNRGNYYSYKCESTIEINEATQVTVNLRLPYAGNEYPRYFTYGSGMWLFSGTTSYNYYGSDLYDYFKIYVKYEDGTTEYKTRLDGNAVWSKVSNGRVPANTVVDVPLTITNIRDKQTSITIQIYYYPGVFYHKRYGSFNSTSEKILNINMPQALTSPRYSGWISSFKVVKEVLQSATNNTNQTLLLDVGLGVGEVRRLNKVYLNDQEVSNYYKTDKYGNQLRTIEYTFRNGYRGDTYRNAETQTINETGIVYNTNFSVKNTVYTTITNVDTDNNRITVSDGTLFTPGTSPVSSTRVANKLEDAANSLLYVHDVSGDVVTIYQATDENSEGAEYNVGNFKAGQNLYFSPDKYTDFHYDTIGDHIDNVEVCVAYNSGIYGVYKDGDNAGKLYSIDSEYNIKIYHKSDWDSNGSNATPILDKNITCSGNKRQKVYHNYRTVTGDLTEDSDGRKKYHIVVRKKTKDTDYDQYYVDYGMSIPYVEELIDNDFAYNETAYVSMRLPASSNINGGVPNLKFNIDGLLLPNPLPDVLYIDSNNSSTTNIN